MEGLPKQFLSSLKILFDILDENRTGFIRLQDIESRWSDDGVRGLPAGIVDSLRKVTPSNGLLSFDKFVSGLKLVLNSRESHIENEYRKPFMSKENYFQQLGYHSSKEDASYDNKSYTRQPPPFASNNSRAIRSLYDQSTGGYKNENHSGRNLASNLDNEESRFTLKPDVSDYPNVTHSHQSQNPQFLNGRRGSQSNLQQHEKAPVIPPRAGRSISYLKKSQSGPDLHHSQSPPPAIPPRQSTNSHVISDLRNWQKEWTMNQNQTRPSADSRSQSSFQDQNAIYANIDLFQRKREALSNQANAGPQKATVRRHGSGRRHTLTSGIDQNMMRRMKQLDEEASMLRAGLSMLDSARDWYTKQLSLIADKQSMQGKVSYNDNSLEAHQERMNFQRTQISEVNQCLRTLLESSEKGFPLHMNLAMPSKALTTGSRDKDSHNTILVDKNRRLIEEVNQKTDIIAQLEKEKATLVRDLFETRSKNRMVHNHNDTTFM